MKPLLLKINGFNSFEELQEIDFAKLTSTGLFGIFGPTGSGKSSIIDAITLALYGKISRYPSDRDMDFINSGSDKAYIYFEFAIRELTYVVERSYARQNEKTKFSGGRLYKKSASGETTILSDSKKTLSQEVEQILGLKYSDFTRTVVLPQHKFSEFLLMQNLERRGMLENIFNLEKYGETMYRKIKNELDSLNLKIRDTQTLLSSYGHISDEVLEEKKSEHLKEMSEIEALRKQSEELRIKSDRLIKLKEINDERREYEKILRGLKAREAEIQEKRKLLSKVEKAELIKPFIKALFETERKISENSRGLKLQEELFRKLSGELLTAEKSYEGLRKAREEAQPLMARRELELTRALALKPEILEVEKELLKLRKSYETVKKKAEELRELIKSSEINGAEEMAALLATTLAEGTPCPVCGSTVHPRPHPGLTKGASIEIVPGGPSPAPRNKGTEELAALETEKSVIESRGLDKKAEVNKLKAQLNEIIGDAEPEVLLKEIKKQSQKMTDEENAARIKLETLRESKQSAELSLAQCRQTDNTLKEILAANRSKLEAILPENSFASVEEAAAGIISTEKREAIQRELKEYDETFSRVQGIFESSGAKLTGVNLETLDLEAGNLLKNFNENVKILDHKSRNCAIIESQVSKMSDDLTKMKALAEKQKTYSRKASLLSDLEGLLKGKKFIEFIAARKLSRITAEASKRLKEMTSGRYAFELMDTEFIIRDDYCGGKRRSPKTLSGGETFIASLCLALALSSGIQLKNNAPLEFFFLDEGFGSLDPLSLDLVMNCLEQLRLEKLSVGVITHVDEVKNRMPVKLQVTPAQQGLHGALVSIEF